MSNAIRTSAPLRALVLLTAAIALLAVPSVASAKAAKDGDRDGMPTKWEKKNKLNPRKNDAKRDKDHDGLVNIAEYRSHTKARVKDSDHDGLRDSSEDPDRDKLVNKAEYLTGNNPLDADTDDDGVKDAAEGAGIVKSFTGGTLTLKLFTGGTLTGKVSQDDCDPGFDDENAPDDSDDLGDDSDETGDDLVQAAHNDEPEVEGDTDGDGVTDPDYDPTLDESDEEDEAEDWDDSECGAANIAAGAVVVEFKYSQVGGRGSFSHVKFAK